MDTIAAMSPAVLLQPMTNQPVQTVLPEGGTWSSYGDGQNTVGTQDVDLNPPYPNFCDDVKPIVHTSTGANTRHRVNDDALQNIGSNATIGTFTRVVNTPGASGTWQSMNYTVLNWPMHSWDIVWDPLNGQVRAQMPMATYEFRTPYIQSDLLKGYNPSLTDHLWVHITATITKSYAGDGEFRLTVWGNGQYIGTAAVTHETTGTYPLTFFDEGKPDDKTNVDRGPNWGEAQAEPSATTDTRHLVTYFTAGSFTDEQIQEIQDAWDANF